MKILEANAGVLTNFDALNFLKSKGASEGLSRVLAKVTPSEYKVYDYLGETPACTQTRENINEFKENCRKYDLAEAEVLNIINTRPSNIVAVYPIIEDCDVRLGDDVQDLVDLVVEVFPAPPSGTDESDSKTTNVEGTEDPKEGDQNDNNTEKPESADIMDSSDGS